MFNRSTILAALLFLVSAVPLRANGVHLEKGASGEGLSEDAFFEASTTVNGIVVTPFDDQGTIFDVFQIPNSFTSGTPFTLTFNSVAPVAGEAVYGIFDCDNGSNGFAISADSTPVDIGTTCTAAALGTSESFVSFNEVGTTSTISFLGGAGAPPTFFFWTTPGNLLDIEPASSTSATPEPSALLLLASGLAALALLRRRMVTRSVL
jgi:hypothetical protein